MANVTYTVPNKNGSYDGDMVVKQYDSVTINSGDTVTVDQPCRGIMILVNGDMTINGTLSMKGRGPNANPTTSGASDSNAVDSYGFQLPIVTSGGASTLASANTLLNGFGNDARTVVANFPSLSSSGDILRVLRTGSGDVTINTNGSNPVNGVVGSSGTNSTGGGGSGSCGHVHSNVGAVCKGTSGTCFGGGSGGGGLNGTNSWSNNNYCDASPYGGSGGYFYEGHTSCCTPCQGNPEGSGTNISGVSTAVKINSGESGNGGLIVLVVKGNLTIGASGKIDCSGSDADDVDGNGYNWLGSGGATGGGAVRIACKGTFTNNGTIDVSGGVGGSCFDGGDNQYVPTGGAGNGGVGTSVSVTAV